MPCAWVLSVVAPLWVTVWVVAIAVVVVLFGMG
jgi:hypothetical protein